MVEDQFREAACLRRPLTLPSTPPREHHARDHGHQDHGPGDRPPQSGVTVQDNTHSFDRPEASLSVDGRQQQVRAGGRALRALNMIPSLRLGQGVIVFTDPR
jgi:hypothetical protein